MGAVRYAMSSLLVLAWLVLIYLLGVQGVELHWTVSIVVAFLASTGFGLSIRDLVDLLNAYFGRR